MSLRTLLNRSSCRQDQKKAKKRPRRAHPLLEALEDRTMPSLMIVNAAGDGDARDSFLTLREAIKLANGQLALSELTDN